MDSRTISRHPKRISDERDFETSAFIMIPRILKRVEPKTLSTLSSAASSLSFVDCFTTKPFALAKSLEITVIVAPVSGNTGKSKDVPEGFGTTSQSSRGVGSDNLTLEIRCVTMFACAVASSSDESAAACFLGAEVAVAFFTLKQKPTLCPFF